MLSLDSMEDALKRNPTLEDYYLEKVRENADLLSCKEEAICNAIGLVLETNWINYFQEEVLCFCN